MSGIDTVGSSIEDSDEKRAVGDVEVVPSTDEDLYIDPAREAALLRKLDIHIAPVVSYVSNFLRFVLLGCPAGGRYIIKVQGLTSPLPSLPLPYPPLPSYASSRLFFFFLYILDGFDLPFGLLRSVQREYISSLSASFVERGADFDRSSLLPL